MYLVGKYDFCIDAATLRRVISRWYYMVSVTSYYTSSYEAVVQQDLNNLGNLHSAEEFVRYIDNKINTTFTDDYFRITLPATLETSSANTPVWNAYVAAQNVLDSRALFSNLHIRELFAPGSSGTKSAVEKHHLWPKNYLPTIGYKEDRDRNQVANFAFIEWRDNIDISDDAPELYWPVVTENIGTVALQEMMNDNALPDDWIHMSYSDFLESRRKLMADVIRRGYESLKSV